LEEGRCSLAALLREWEEVAHALEEQGTDKGSSLV
jgi:hypothetical protein